MYGKTIDEVEWYKAMSTDTRDCVRICLNDGRELVPYDTLERACKCAARPRHCAQWSYAAHAMVVSVDVVQDVRGYMRVTLYVD